MLPICSRSRRPFTIHNHGEALLRSHGGRSIHTRALVCMRPLCSRSRLPFNHHDDGSVAVDDQVTHPLAEWQPGQEDPAAALLQVALRLCDSGRCVALVLVRPRLRPRLSHGAPHDAAGVPPMIAAIARPCALQCG